MASVHAGYAYEAEAYAGPVTLLRTGAASRHFLQTDPTWGWSKLAGGGVSVRIVPGGHMNLLRPPHVRALARELRHSLELAL
jgi:thioesterase domain-containing protein